MSVPRTELGAHLAALGDVGALDDELLGVAIDVREFFAGWSVDELDVLGWVADRLNKGREDYGSLDLEADARDWLREAQEEATDLVAYAAIAAIKAMGRALAPALTGDEEEGELAVHSCASEVARDKWARDGRRETGDEWTCSCGALLVHECGAEGCSWRKRVPVAEQYARMRVPAPPVPPPPAKVRRS